MVDADEDDGSGRFAHHQHRAGDETGEGLPQRLRDGGHDTGEDGTLEALGGIAALRQ